MTLLLHCSLCGRKQADGLLSRNAWGHLPLDDGTVLRACSSCKSERSDWEMRLRATGLERDPDRPEQARLEARSDLGLAQAALQGSHVGPASAT